MWEKGRERGREEERWREGEREGGREVYVGTTQTESVCMLLLYTFFHVTVSHFCTDLSLCRRGLGLSGDMQVLTLVVQGPLHPSLTCKEVLLVSP